MSRTFPSAESKRAADFRPTPSDTTKEPLGSFGRLDGKGDFSSELVKQIRCFFEVSTEAV